MRPCSSTRKTRKLLRRRSGRRCATSKLRRRLRDAGFARARLFSWDDAARQTLDVYGELARQPSKVVEKEAAKDAA